MKTPVPYLNWHHTCYLWCVVIATRPCTRRIGLRCFPLVLRIGAYRKHMEQNVSHNLFVAHQNLILWSSIYVTHCLIFQPNSMAVMLFLMGTACGNFAYQYIPGYLFSLYGVRCFMYILLQNAVCILVLFIAMQLVARTQGTRFSRATPDTNSEEDQTDETSRMNEGIKPAGQNAHGEDEIVAIPLNRDISENVVTWNLLSESSSYDCRTVLSGMCVVARGGYPERVSKRPIYIVGLHVINHLNVQFFIKNWASFPQSIFPWKCMVGLNRMCYVLPSQTFTPRWYQSLTFG